MQKDDYNDEIHSECGNAPWPVRAAPTVTGGVSKLGGGVGPNMLRSHYKNDEIVTSWGKLAVISVVRRYEIAMEVKSCC